MSGRSTRARPRGAPPTPTRPTVPRPTPARRAATRTLPPGRHDGEQSGEVRRVEVIDEARSLAHHHGVEPRPVGGVLGLLTEQARRHEEHSPVALHSAGRGRPVSSWVRPQPGHSTAVTAYRASSLTEAQAGPPADPLVVVGPGPPHRARPLLTRSMSCRVRGAMEVDRADVAQVVRRLEKRPVREALTCRVR